MKARVLFHRQWWVGMAKDGHRLAVSLWCFAVFLGLAVCRVVFGPTLLDVAQKLHVGVGTISLMFLVRGIGNVMGTVGYGVLMDCFPQLTFTLLCIVIIAASAATAAVPFSVHIAMLTVLMLVYGIAFGAWLSGAHAVLMKMWKEKSAPCIQFVHFAYAFGAFIAPLISKPFIEDIDTDSLNQSLVMNVSCADPMSCSTNSSGCDLLPICIDAIASACNTSTDRVIDVQRDPEDPSNCSVISMEQAGLTFSWAYWISATTLILPLLAFIYFAVRYDFRNKSKRRVTVEIVSNTDQEEYDKKENTSDRKIKPQNSSSLKTYKFPSLIILFFFMLLYVGTEGSFGNLLFTYAVKSDLGFSKGQAATLGAVFWGIFSFGRLCSIGLALLGLRASIIMTMNLCGALLATTLFLILPHNNTAIWIICAVFGLSIGSVYATAMTWLNENFNVTGKAIAVAVSGGSFGNIIIPTVVGALIGSVSPNALVYCTFFAIAMCSILFTILVVITFIYGRTHLQSAGSVRYTKLDENNESETNPELEIEVELEEVHGDPTE